MAFSSHAITYTKSVSCTRHEKNTKIFTPIAESLFQKKGFIRPLLTKKKTGLRAWNLKHQQCGQVEKTVPSLVLSFASDFTHRVGGKDVSHSERIYISYRQRRGEKVKECLQESAELTCKEEAEAPRGNSAWLCPLFNNPGNSHLNFYNSNIH